MISNVTIEQIQTVDETIKSSFEGEVLKKTENTIKIVYKNQNKLHNLIIEKVSNEKILLGTLSHLNELIINKITDFTHSADGYTFNLKSKLNNFVFDDSKIEIYYDLLLDDSILSHNILRIVYKN